MKRRMENTTANDDETELRRERGRQAQQAFRQRQIKTIKELREQNQAMQAAIASLAQIAAQLGKPELNDAIRNAQEAAGMEEYEDTECSERETNDSPPKSPRLRSETLLDHDESGSSRSLQLPSKGLTERQLSSRGDEPALLEHRPSDKTFQQEGNVANILQLAHQRGRMSPRLNYGIFLERPLFRLVNPPVDIIPYLEERSTLSHVVFWTALVWGLKLLQAALTPEGNSQAMVTANKIFGQISPMKPDRSIINGIHARLKYHNLGYVESDHPGYDPDGGTRIQNLMARTCADNGTPLETFLRPDAAEALIRNRLGQGYGAVELGLQGRGTTWEASRARFLVEKMVRGSVCLGDGPRWRRDHLERILNSWIRASGPSSEKENYLGTRESHSF